MNYSFSQLRVFQKVVETGSVTRAAVALHLSQPAVSVQLRNFQNNFDLPLTEVIGRQLYVTEFGHEIAALVNLTLGQLESIDQQAAIHRGQLSGRLKIATASTGKYVLPYFLSSFLKENPGIETAMDVTNKSNVIEALKRNQIDIGLVSILPAKIKVNTLDLLQNELHLVGKQDPQVSGIEILNDSDYPLIYREQGSGTRSTMERFIEVKKISVRKQLQLTSNEAVKQGVLAGLGYSIMPLIGLRNELETGQLKILPTKGLPIKNHWRLIWLEGKTLAPVPTALIEYLKKQRETIIAQHFSWLANY